MALGIQIFPWAGATQCILSAMLGSGGLCSRGETASALGCAVLWRWDAGQAGWPLYDYDTCPSPIKSIGTKVYAFTRKTTAS